jgi:hypothetical protein
MGQTRSSFVFWVCGIDDVLVMWRRTLANGLKSRLMVIEAMIAAISRFKPKNLEALALDWN